MHERFPDRVNSEFIRVIDRRHLQMRVGAGQRRDLGLRDRCNGQCVATA